jgi:hypothetical protein
VLSLAPLKRVALSAHDPPSKPRSQPPYIELLAEYARGGLVVATEVVGSIAPPPPATADDSGKERMVVKTAVSQVALELQVGTTSSDGDVVMVSVEQAVPPALPTRDHEVIAPAATETPAPVTALAGGGMAEASACGSGFP